MEVDKNMAIGTLLLIPMIILGGAVIFNDIMFDIEIGGHMKRAADANTVDTAIEEMTIVVKNMETNGMTHGYTSVIYKTPDEDVGFLYNNMVSALNELEELPENASTLEKTNTLMKLRETLLDNKGTGDKINVPDGISRYPYNKIYAVLLVISSICALISIKLNRKRIRNLVGL